MPTGTGPSDNTLTPFTPFLGTLPLMDDSLPCAPLLGHQQNQASTSNNPNQITPLHEVEEASTKFLVINQVSEIASNVYQSSFSHTIKNNNPDSPSPNSMPKDMFNLPTITNDPPQSHEIQPSVWQAPPPKAVAESPLAVINAKATKSPSSAQPAQSRSWSFAAVR